MKENEINGKEANEQRTKKPEVRAKQANRNNRSKDEEAKIAVEKDAKQQADHALAC